tara:strand:+ start:464 stop:610 length:147 start_codon:yes stop_codon:yes gene_type:complete
MGQMKHYVLWLEEKGYIEWDDHKDNFVEAKDYDTDLVFSDFLKEDINE